MRDGRVRSLTAILVAASVPFLGSGCAFLNGSSQAITIRTNVPARVSVDGRYLGDTGSAPLEVKLERGEPHFVAASAEGYEPKTVALNRRVSAFGVVDFVVGAFVVVPFVTFLTGHAWDFEPRELEVQLEPFAVAPKPPERF